MTAYDIKLDETKVLGLLTESGQLQEMVSSILNQVLQAQCSEQLGAEPHERSSERKDYRNGERPRQIYTRIGKLHLRVPQTRHGTFSTDLFKRYQRSEQALVLSFMEMYLQGVSTRKVTKITEELCGAQFSKSTVSQLCLELDARVNAWRSRRLDEHTYPFLIVDAMVVKCRKDGAIRSTGILIPFGVNQLGEREILGVYEADSESQSSWSDVFLDLKNRGLKGVELIVSDQHQGLVNAAQKHFQGSAWQRCQVHFIRNILGYAPKRYRREIAEKLKAVFASADAKTAKLVANALIEEYEDKAPKAMLCLESGLDDALSILNLPEPYRRRLRTSNLAERVNEEVRRREKVIRIFPNEASAIRLIGAILVEIHEKWLSGNRYFDMTEYHDWKQNKQNKTNNNENKVIQLR